MRWIWRKWGATDQLCGCGEPFADCPFWTKVASLAFGGWDGVDARGTVALEEEVVRFRTLPLEHDDVLPGQGTDRFFPNERVRRHFFFHLRLGHFVNALDRHVRILLPKFHKHQPTAHLQRPHHSIRHLKRMIKFMIDIHHYDQIDRIRRKPRITHRAQRLHHVGNATLLHVRAEQIKHLYVRNNRGELIPMSEVVQLSEKPSLSQINRYNRERAIKIWANVKTGQSVKPAGLGAKPLELTADDDAREALVDWMVSPENPI